MSGRARSANLFLTLIVANAILTAGVLASQGPDWRSNVRTWAIFVFGLALLLAASGALVGSRRSAPPASLSASATENPDDLRTIEFILAVASVVASVVGSILSAVGVG